MHNLRNLLLAFAVVPLALGIMGFVVVPKAITVGLFAALSLLSFLDKSYFYAVLWAVFVLLGLFS